MIVTNLESNAVLKGVEAEPVVVNWRNKVKDVGDRKVLSREPKADVIEIVLRQSNGTNDALLMLSKKTRGIAIKITLQEIDDSNNMIDTMDINLRDCVPAGFSMAEDDWVLILETITEPEYTPIP